MWKLLFVLLTGTHLVLMVEGKNVACLSLILTIGDQVYKKNVPNSLTKVQKFCWGSFVEEGGEGRWIPANNLQG